MSGAARLNRASRPEFDEVADNAGQYQAVADDEDDVALRAIFALALGAMLLLYYRRA